MPNGTPAGTYTMTYEICDPVYPWNCDVATISITLTNNFITANPDFAWPAFGASVVVPLLSNDSLSGAVADVSTVTGSLT